MKKQLITLIILSNINLYASDFDSAYFNNKLEQQIHVLNVLSDRVIKNESAINKQRKNINLLSDTFSSQIFQNKLDIANNSKELSTKIKETSIKADSKIAELDGNVEKNRLYWVIATLGTIIIGGIIYWLLMKRISSSKIDVETQIRKTKESLETESVKLDNKLIEVLETQLKIQQETTLSQPVNSSEKDDHSLALKVADEIIRIQKNLNRMDEKTKGLKQLNSSVKRIQDNFASNGYELVDMLGKEYNEGMKATVNFVQDEDLAEGKKIITRIIKPQVNFKGTMIQTAQIEVTES